MASDTSQAWMYQRNADAAKSSFVTSRFFYFSLFFFVLLISVCLVFARVLSTSPKLQPSEQSRMEQTFVNPCEIVTSSKIKGVCQIKGGSSESYCQNFDSPTTCPSILCLWDTNSCVASDEGKRVEDFCSHLPADLCTNRIFPSKCQCDCSECADKDACFSYGLSWACPVADTKERCSRIGAACTWMS